MYGHIYIPFCKILTTHNCWVFTQPTTPDFWPAYIKMSGCIQRRPSNSGAIQCPPPFKLSVLLDMQRDTEQTLLFSQHLQQITGTQVLEIMNMTDMIISSRATYSGDTKYSWPKCKVFLCVNSVNYLRMAQISAHHVGISWWCAYIMKSASNSAAEFD